MAAMNLKYVAKVRVVFNPFQWKTAAAREFLRTLDAEQVRNSNPKCQIQSETTNSNVNPQVEILFADKELLTFDASEMKTTDILKQFNQKCKEKEEPS